MAVTISNQPRYPRITRNFFISAAREVLGRTYKLSVAFVSAAEMRKNNRIYRGKDEATDILSFPLGETNGEILLCLSETRRRAAAFGRPAGNFIRFLFIHGLLHLKGYRHGVTMEREECKFRERFGI